MRKDGFENGNHVQTHQVEPLDIRGDGQNCVPLLKFFFSLINLFILFIYFRLCWVFIVVCGLCLFTASGGFSCCGARALGMWVSVVVALRLSSCSLRALEHGLSSYGARAQLLRGMWDLPGPGLKPVSPALAGGFLTTAPPGKSRHRVFMEVIKLR